MTPATPAFEAAALEGYDDPETTIGEVRFIFDRMGAMEGWRVLESIRTEMATTELPSGADAGESFIRMVMALSPAFIDRLRQTMFAHVRFSRSTNTLLRLAGGEDMAFEGLEPIAIYEVLLRSLAVNFTPSWRDLASRLGLGGA